MVIDARVHALRQSVSLPNIISPAQWGISPSWSALSSTDRPPVDLKRETLEHQTLS